MARWKKIIIGVATITGIFVAVFMGGFAYLFSDMCGSYPHKTITSPDGEYDAVIYRLDCGATTGFSTHVSIVEAGGKLPNESGNIFSGSGNPRLVAPDVTWVNKSHLNIHKLSSVTVYKLEESWGGHATASK